MGLFKAIYTGSASACTLIVDTINWVCYTKTGGVDDRSVDIDFDKSKSVEWFVNQWNSYPSYEFTKIEDIHGRQLVYVAKACTLNIKNVIDSVVLDRPRFYAWEFDSSKLYLERMTGKPCLELTYPGNNTDPHQVPYIRDAGYLGARTTTPSTVVMSDTFPLYRLPTQFEAFEPKCVMNLDNNTKSATKSTDFTGVNISHNSTLQKEYDGCGVLNGSAYLYRNDTSFNYSSGDYTVGIWVRPTVLNSINTVFYTGVNSDSCLTVYIDSNGAVHYIQRRGGVDVIHLTSNNNSIPLDQWTRLVFRQTIDTVSVFTDENLPAKNRIAVGVTNTTPDIYNGITYFGTNFSTGSASNSFVGYFDKIDIGFDNWYRTISAADMFTTHGCFASSLTHGDYLGPRDLYKTAIDALATYSGRTQVIGMGPALQILRANGTFTDSDSLYITWNQPDSADYRLRSDSRLAGSGDVSVLSGIPNLINLSGDTITDASGNLLVSSVNIGAYGTYEIPDTTPSAPTFTSVSPSSPRLFKTFEATGTNLSNCKLYLNSVSLGAPASATSTSISDTALGTTRGFHWLIAEDTLTGMRCSTSSRIYIKNTQLDTVLLGRP